MDTYQKYMRVQADKEPYGPKRGLLLQSPITTPTQGYALLNLMKPRSALQYVVPPDKAPTFPQDHGRHYDTASDWYFLVGHLQEKTNPQNKFAFLLLFQSLTLAGPKVLDKGVNTQHTAVETAQLNVVSMPDQKFYSGTQRIVPASQTHGTVDPFSWTFDAQNTLTSHQKGAIFPMDVKASDTGQGTSIALTATATKPMFLEGKDGFIGFKVGSRSAVGWQYYSYTALQLDGSLTVNQKTYDVCGIGWFDHQWGTAGTLQSAFLRGLIDIVSVFKFPEGFAGWNWFAVQLNNNVQFTTAYMNVWNRDGSVVLSNDNKGFYGKYALADGSTKWVTKGVTIDVLKRIMSPVTHSSYPIQWRIREESQGLDVVMTAMLQDQFSYRVDGSEYAENAVTITGTYQGKPVTGVGWGENVGFQTQQSLYGTQLQKAGLPATADNVHILQVADYEVSKKAGWAIMGYTLLGIVGLIVFFVVLHRVAKRRRPSPVTQEK